MKKHICKLAALLLCVCMLSLSLCGCSILERFGIELPELPFLEDAQKADLPEQSGETVYVLSGPTDFYEEPDWDSRILATYYEGYTVTYSSVVTIDDVQWASTGEGWFVLNGKKPVEILESYTVQLDCVVTVPVTVYTEPSTASSEMGQLHAGTLVPIREIAHTAEGKWGRLDDSWVSMEQLYTVGDVGQYHCFGVVRENNASFFSAPGVQSYTLTTAASGARFEVLEQICIDGAWWGYTESGWISMAQMYAEGTEGTRPCSAIVIDPTPLNVRIAPGTDKEILTTLTYGDHVNILERVNYNGSDWGFTGTGWIFMDLTEIQ